ncbi:MAG: transketolase C-terminal domain-containing protein [bacterium]|nr:transketolase C-terminal domain-containing protein [bacterium]
MINPSVKLNPKLFDADVEQNPIRKGFGEGLLAAAEADERVVGLCADLTESTQMHLFAKKFPERFVQIGVAEQNLATVASGMASMGKIPFISSYSMFSPGRNWEQIRTTVCYNDQPVKIAGSHAGVSVGPDGGTHQAIEDMAIMRVIPRMVVISPCDSIEAKKATMAVAKTKNPTYIRLAREKTPVMTTEDSPFEIGKAQVFYKSENMNSKQKVGIVATGALVYKAIMAAKKLEEEGIEVTVLNLSTIKPLDETMVLALAKQTEALVTVEEHQIAGGVGSAVAEFLSQNHPVPIEFVGVRDEFGQTGTPEELIEHYGMGATHIVAAVKHALRRK